MPSWLEASMRDVRDTALNCDKVPIVHAKQKEHPSLAVDLKLVQVCTISTLQTMIQTFPLHVILNVLGIKEINLPNLDKADPEKSVLQSLSMLVIDCFWRAPGDYSDDVSRNRCDARHGTQTPGEGPQNGCVVKATFLSMPPETSAKMKPSKDFIRSQCLTDSTLESTKPSTPPKRMHSEHSSRSSENVPAESHGYINIA